MKLSDLKKFEKAKVLSVDLDHQAVRKRLSDLGLQQGQEVTCLVGSPWGGVGSYQLTNGVFALEDWICKKVQVEKVDSK